ncbi:hypothetical protein GCM10023215_46720 [Pseudonocardia yuanmonensis]|uniref:Zinc-binding dehydrogenase n=2 Tax=Pseudonocardia yuanmonensis TaxID=1095914 RepID=A0ABP8XAF2_9PSEU
MDPSCGQSHAQDARGRPMSWLGVVEIVDRVRDGRLRAHVGTVATPDEAIPALNPTERRNGKTVIRVRP